MTIIIKKIRLKNKGSANHSHDEMFDKEKFISNIFKFCRIVALKPDGDNEQRVRLL